MKCYKDFDTAITKLLKPMIKNKKYATYAIIFSKVITCELNAKVQNKEIIKIQALILKKTLTCI